MDLGDLNVLCCRITIGDPDPENPMRILNPVVLTEVKQVEISETYKKLVGTAKVIFPKGTVYHSTIIGSNTVEGVDAGKLTAEIMEDGVIVEQRSTQVLMDKDSFVIGQRINIKLGYDGVLKSMFDGYITGYNSDSLFRLECKNMAYKLMLKQAPVVVTPKVGTKINDVLGEKYGFLKDTGFKLHSETKKFDIEIGSIETTDNFTVADVLESWSKAKLYCFLKVDRNAPDEMPAIAVGRPYSSSKEQPAFPQEHPLPFQVFFHYHVASDNLEVLRTDPKFLAVRAQGLGKDEKFFTVTVRLNPEHDPTDKQSKEFQVVNATQVGKKSHKLTGNVTAKGAKTKTKVDLSTYTVVPYMSQKMGITSDELVEEAIEYFRGYNQNGIKGSLTLFGDLALTSAVQVELIDERNPSKNGVYLVEEVTTTFGTEGYRQRITVPYKIRSNGKE